VDTARNLVEAGLHPATGGDGAAVCSGDMLLEALVACAGVTLRAVATAIGIDVRDGTVKAEGDLDFRGTLGVAKDAPVGFRDIRVKFSLDSDATEEQLNNLFRLTERYCVGVPDSEEPASAISCAVVLHERELQPRSLRVRVSWHARVRHRPHDARCGPSVDHRTIRIGQGARRAAPPYHDLRIIVASLVFGPMVDRYGYKGILLVATALILVGLEGIAFAPTLASLRVAIALIGFGGGIVNGGTNAVVADISGGERGSRLNLLGVFFGISAVGVPFVLATLTGRFSQSALMAGVGALVVVPFAVIACKRISDAEAAAGISSYGGGRTSKRPGDAADGLRSSFSRAEWSSRWADGFRHS
jgi:uncharacterized OsmC-like protein